MTSASFPTTVIICRHRHPTQHASFHVQYSSFGNRSFGVAGLGVWNGLPLSTQQDIGMSSLSGY